MKEYAPKGERPRVSVAADRCAKAACLLMVCALLTFSARFHWRAVRTELGDIILISDHSVVGLYLVGASLICAIAWFVLAVGFKVTHLADDDSGDEYS